MRKIEIKSWRKSLNGKELEENFIMVLKAVLNTVDVKGIDKFRMFGRLGKAFEKAKNSIELEEGDYSFMKGLLEKELPAKWGMIEEVLENVELFMEAKPEKSP